MQNFFMAIGVLVCAAFIAGAIIPGVAFHAYFGSSKGAAKWHADACAQKGDQS